MGLEKVVIGARVFVIDRDQKVLFTRAEVQKARDRFAKEAGKKIKRELGGV